LRLIQYGVDVSNCDLFRFLASDGGFCILKLLFYCGVRIPLSELEKDNIIDYRCRSGIRIRRSSNIHLINDHRRMQDYEDIRTRDYYLMDKNAEGLAEFMTWL